MSESQRKQTKGKVAGNKVREATCAGHVNHEEPQKPLDIRLLESHCVSVLTIVSLTVRRFRFPDLEKPVPSCLKQINKTNLVDVSKAQLFWIQFLVTNS